MIAFVSGPVAALAPDTAVIEVGGVGMAVQCTPGTLSRLRVGERARLATTLVVREDSLTLYGFADDDERQCFQLLPTASGVRPPLPPAMLPLHRPARGGGPRAHRPPPQRPAPAALGAAPPHPPPRRGDRFVGPGTTPKPPQPPTGWWPPPRTARTAP